MFYVIWYKEEDGYLNAFDNLEDVKKYAKPGGKLCAIEGTFEVLENGKKTRTIENPTLGGFL
ncbi:hypothetical protein [Acinetobacter sp.]|uniref:hypothetical protein n=1 Tax=Acinetobacter sp. TaxID=472 RepID=UPI003D018812